MRYASESAAPAKMRGKKEAKFKRRRRVFQSHGSERTIDELRAPGSKKNSFSTRGSICFSSLLSLSLTQTFCREVISKNERGREIIMPVFCVRRYKHCGGRAAAATKPKKIFTSRTTHDERVGEKRRPGHERRERERVRR